MHILGICACLRVQVFVMLLVILSVAIGPNLHYWHISDTYFSSSNFFLVEFILLANVLLLRNFLVPMNLLKL